MASRRLCLVKKERALYAGLGFGERRLLPLPDDAL